MKKENAGRHGKESSTGSSVISDIQNLSQNGGSEAYQTCMSDTEKESVFD